jgi:6-pyruvoyltetrahydropterin/6-carboxytetrahydropterin synthase
LLRGTIRYRHTLYFRKGSALYLPIQLYYVQPMFTLRVTDSFSAAHRLRGYHGDCERLHGHNYKVEVSIESTDLDETGIVIDFRDVKNILKDALDEMDHQYLNELAAFSDRNPSAENIARHIFTTISDTVKHPARLKEVVVWENENCSVSYSG